MKDMQARLETPQAQTTERKTIGDVLGGRLPKVLNVLRSPRLAAAFAGPRNVAFASCASVPPSSPMEAGGYIKGFDGLRAISAIGVIGLHLGLPGFSLGWSGVYLFFVLSGFLITRILRKERHRAGYFQRFWTRRALRIFPIYYLVLLLVIGVALLAHRPIADWPWFFFYLQNYRLAFTGWQSAFPKMISHTWTLANEEQFYWLWPVMVYLCRTRNLAWLIVGIILSAWVCRTAIISLSQNLSLIFAPLPCTMDFLAWGALGAIFAKDLTDRRGLLLAIFATLTALVVALVWAKGLDAFWTSDVLASFTYGVVFLGLLAPLFLCLLLIVSTTPMIANWLEFKPLRYLGRISYGLYLYHVPVLFGCHSLGVLDYWPIKAALTILIACASYEMIERPLLARKEALTRYSLG